MKLIRNFKTVISDPRFAVEYADYCGSKLRYGYARKVLPGGITLSSFSGFSEFHSVKDFVSPVERAFFTTFPFGNGDVFDIGANLGVVSLTLAKNLHGRNIFAFEPNPYTFAALLDNVRLNHAREVKPQQAAVADLDGTIAFSAESLRRGTASISKEAEAETSTDVPAVTVDSFAARHNVRSIAFMKVDVEGYETAVFEGADRTIREQLASVIYYEVCPEITRRAGYQPLEPTRLLQSAGYEIFVFNNEAKLVRIAPAHEIDSVVCENWVALSPSQIVAAGSWIC